MNCNLSSLFAARQQPPVSPFDNVELKMSTFPFIKYLDALKDKGEKSKTAEYIGNIFLKMLEKNTPNFDQKHIRSIVEFLYNSGGNDSAKKIYNIYGSRGEDFFERCL